MGTIFSPVLGFDHFESLVGVRARSGRHYEIREGGEDEGEDDGGEGRRLGEDADLHLGAKKGGEECGRLLGCLTLRVCGEQLTDHAARKGKRYELGVKR